MPRKRPASKSKSPPSSKRPRKRTNLCLAKEEQDARWNDCFQRLLQFRQTYGHTIVPQRYESDPQLGMWVNAQRKAYRRFKMRPDHWQQLQRIDFVFAVDSQRNPIIVTGGCIDHELTQSLSQSTKMTAAVKKPSNEQHELEDDEQQHEEEEDDDNQQHDENDNDDEQEDEENDNDQQHDENDHDDEQEEHNDDVDLEKQDEKPPSISTDNVLFHVDDTASEHSLNAATGHYSDAENNDIFDHADAAAMHAAVEERDGKEYATIDATNVASVVREFNEQLADEETVVIDEPVGKDAADIENSEKDDPSMDEVEPAESVQKEKGSAAANAAANKDDNIVATSALKESNDDSSQHDNKNANNYPAAINKATRVETVLVDGGKNGSENSFVKKNDGFEGVQADMKTSGIHCNVDEEVDQRPTSAEELEDDEEKEKEEVGLDSCDSEETIAKIKAQLPLPRVKPAAQAVFKDMLRRLKKYKRRFGDTMVPQNYKPDMSLGSWVCDQRKKLKAQSLNQAHFQTLVDLDFEWSLDKTRKPIPLQLNFVKEVLPPLSVRKTRKTCPGHLKSKATLVTMNNAAADKSNPALLSSNENKFQHRRPLSRHDSVVASDDENKPSFPAGSLAEGEVDWSSAAPNAPSEDCVTNNTTAEMSSNSQLSISEHIVVSKEGPAPDATAEAHKGINPGSIAPAATEPNDDCTLVLRATELANEPEKRAGAIGPFAFADSLVADSQPMQLVVDLQLDPTLHSQTPEPKLAQKARQDDEMDMKVAATNLHQLETSDPLRSYSAKEKPEKALTSDDFTFLDEGHPKLFSGMATPTNVTGMASSQTQINGTTVHEAASSRKMINADQVDEASPSDEADESDRAQDFGDYTFAIETAIETLFPLRDLSVDCENLGVLLKLLRSNRLYEDYLSKSFSHRYASFVSDYKMLIADPIQIDDIIVRFNACEYESSRDVLSDICLALDQYTRFFSHIKAENAKIVLFVTLHMRDYVLRLWEEYMLPSDPPLRLDRTFPMFEERKMKRKLCMQYSGNMIIPMNALKHFSTKLDDYIASGGLLDKVDAEPLSSLVGSAHLENNLKDLSSKLSTLLSQNDPVYRLETFHQDLLECAAPESASAHYERITNRLARFFWQTVAPLHEANSRGMQTSSIWAEMTDLVWARYGSKAPYWPALVLGMVVPSEDADPMASLVLEHNESRLPKKERKRLMLIRKNCERKVKCRKRYYALVELLGIHEFHWVSRSQLKDYDPNCNPNDGTSTHLSQRFKELLPVAMAEIDGAAAQYDTHIDTAYDQSIANGSECIDAKASDDRASTKF